MNSNESLNFPSLLKHMYPIEKPNQKILLYEGNLEIKQELEQDTIIAKGSGDVYLKWFPYPHIEFNLSGEELLRLRPDNYEAFVKLPNTENSVQAIAPISHSFNQINGETKEIKKGNIREPLVVGSGQDLKYVQFYLTNFEKFSVSQIPVYDSELCVGYRATFAAEGWEVIIDSVKDLENHLNLLKAQGGYAITHVGRVSRLNGEDFTAEEVLNFLEILSDFLSFVRGIRISPLLLVGYDESEQPIWKVWSSSNSEPWQTVYTWAWGLSAEMIAEVFPGFYRWQQSWGEEAKLAIYWYLMTELTKIESSINLGQSALELLAWVHLVEKEEVFTAGKFENYSASQKINRLLEKLTIPKSIDSRLNALVQYNSNELDGEFRSNGAYALSKVRNDMVHSSPSNRQRLFNTSSSVTIEAAKLIRWYLELCFLSLSNYQGFYCNCLDQHISWGSTEIVPWNSHNP